MKKFFYLILASLVLAFAANANASTKHHGKHLAKHQAKYAGKHHKHK